MSGLPAWQYNASQTAWIEGGLQHVTQKREQPCSP